MAVPQLRATVVPLYPEADGGGDPWDDPLRYPQVWPPHGRVVGDGDSLARGAVTVTGWYQLRVASSFLL